MKMIQRIKNFIKLMILFLIGGSIYYLIEIAYRGYSHWTMFILGGVCFIVVGAINEYYSWDMSLVKQCVIGAVFITACELAFGIVLNIILGMHIWDYSNVPLNFLGQICLPFSLAWTLLSAIAIFIDDYLRYFLFHEEYPRYHLF